MLDLEEAEDRERRARPAARVSQGGPHGCQGSGPAHGGGRKPLSTMTRVHVDKATFPHIVSANHLGDSSVFHAMGKKSWAYRVAPSLASLRPNERNPGSQVFN